MALRIKGLGVTRRNIKGIPRAVRIKAAPAVARMEAQVFVEVLIAGSRRPGRPRVAYAVARTRRAVSVQVFFGWYGRNFSMVGDYTEQARAAARHHGFRRGWRKAKEAIEKQMRQR